jgi:hypothetical protein
MYVVQGRNAILYALKDAEYVPFLCGQEIGLNEETEIIPTTTVNSGKFRTFVPRFSTWTLSFSGVMLIRNGAAGTGYAALELFTDTIRENGLDIKIIFTDDQGVYQELTGSVLFPSKSITGSVGQITKWAANMQGNGEYTITEFVLPPLLDENNNPILDENGDPVTIP